MRAEQKQITGKSVLGKCRSNANTEYAVGNDKTDIAKVIDDLPPLPFTN
ncbi:MAG: hypothetical protein ACLUIQ_11655 [Dialister invisus]